MTTTPSTDTEASQVTLDSLPTTLPIRALDRDRAYAQALMLVNQLARRVKKVEQENEDLKTGNENLKKNLATLKEHNKAFVKRGESATGSQPSEAEIGGLDQQKLHKLQAKVHGLKKQNEVLMNASGDAAKDFLVLLQKKV